MSENASSVNNYKKEKKKEPTPYEIALGIVRLINHDPTEERRKNTVFARKFHLFEPSPGVYEILEENENEIVHRTSEAALAAAIQKFCTENYLSLMPKVVLEIVKLWMQLTPPLETAPELIRQKNESGLCWHRMPFDTDENGETPLFDEFLSRCSNAEAFKAIVGSLFFKEAMNQNYLWMYGDGFNGKGAFMSILARAFGPAYWSQSLPPNINDKHFIANFEHKRIVSFPDCNSKAFPASGVFKSLTGGDMQTIDRKYKMPYTTYLNCAYFFSSNEIPTLSSEKADIRRAILVEVGPIEGAADAMYKQNLWKEAPFIFGKCIATYQKVCPHHGAIPKEDESLSVIVNEFEEDYEIVVDKFLEIRPEDKGSLVPAKLMKTIQDHAFRGNQKEYFSFLNYLRRKHKVFRIQKKINGKNTDYYVHLAWKGPINNVLPFGPDSKLDRAYE